jgi:Domain of unknown function (DUF1816)
MKLLNILKEVAAGFMQAMSTPWWVEVTTSEPLCTYYFGPFNTPVEAKTAHSGYVEDLTQEGAQGIKVAIKRCNPQTLTICADC